ncbi:MAG: hypothetical protein K0Q61_1842, partial [Rhodococcus erythropolis]|nr:hypothetical protein [Rhodococcus erythropolis]
SVAHNATAAAAFTKCFRDFRMKVNLSKLIRSDVYYIFTGRQPVGFVPGNGLSQKCCVCIQKMVLGV